MSDKKLIISNIFNNEILEALSATILPLLVLNFLAKGVCDAIYYSSVGLMLIALVSMVIIFIALILGRELVMPDRLRRFFRKGLYFPYFFLLLGLILQVTHPEDSRGQSFYWLAGLIFMSTAVMCLTPERLKK